MNLEAELLEREKLFWTETTPHYERWLAEDVLMIFPAPAGKMNRKEVLGSVHTASRWVDVDMTEISVRLLCPTSLLLAYRARARKADPRSDYQAYVGSIYVEEGSEWKLAFHQHTPITEIGTV